MSFSFGAKLVTTPHLQVYHTLSTRPRLIHTHSVIRYGAIDFVSKVNCQRHDSFSVSASGNYQLTPSHEVEAKRRVEHLRAQPQEETCKRCKDCRQKLVLLASSESRQARLTITLLLLPRVTMVHSHCAAAPLPVCMHAKFVNAVTSISLALSLSLSSLFHLYLSLSREHARCKAST
jgi:hypothetical protein